METVTESLAALAEVFQNSMDAFQRDLKKASPTSNTNNLSTDFTAFRQFILSALNTLQQQVSFLGRVIDNQEMQRRRKMLLFHGFTEDGLQNDKNRINRLLSDQLEVHDFNSDSISKCYRLGKPANNKPRPLVVKFSSTELRDKVWFSKTKLKGTGVTQSEFLTKARHDVFLLARKRLGVNNCWTRNGNIYILTNDGSRHRVDTSQDVINLCHPPAENPISLQAKGSNTRPISSLSSKPEARSKRVVKK